ncbi:MAG: hypothetical protein ACI4NA_04130 [Succinivibrio sp.]
MSVKKAIAAAVAVLAAAASTQAIADAEVIDCTSGRCVQAEPATSTTPMKPREGGALPGASLTPSKGQGGLSLKSGARVEPRLGGRIEIRGGKSYSCGADDCVDGTASKR